MNDKKIMVTKPFMPPFKEYEQKLKEIWENKWLTNKGPLYKEFELELKKYLSINNICLTVNGHSSLDIAIKSLGLTGEVITTPFTFASTVHALTMNNIRPVFCDIKESDMTIDENKIESLITKNTTAILAVHVYGHMCNVDKIEKIAKKYNLKVIYDAAHAFGVEYRGKSISSQGDASIFSFHATKLFHTIEGGCAIYKDKNLESLFNAYRNFGIYDEEKIYYVGGNSKMNEFQAAMGLVNLNYIEEIINKRKDLTIYYREKLLDIKGVKYFEPEKFYEFKYNYSYMPILIRKEEFGFSRNELYDKLKKFNIYTRKYFYPCVPDYECYKQNYNNCSIPNARRIADEILCLPIYYDLTYDEIDYICNAIKKIQLGGRHEI